MEFSKYIVPIYADNDYRGNGFIVNSFLVFPYHLIKVNPNSWEVFPSFDFQYEGNKYSMETAANIVCQGNQIDVFLHPNLARDLFVFQTVILGSDLTLSSEYVVNDECEYCGYYKKNDTLITERIPMGIVYQQRAVSNVYGRPVELENCMTCKCTLKPGNSGGLVYQGDNIIGMFIKDQCFPSSASQSIFIKTSYILQTIENNT